jgi:hypothetical protein
MVQFGSKLGSMMLVIKDKSNFVNRFFSDHSEVEEPSPPQKIHPALECFHQLTKLSPAAGLERFLSDFAEPRPVDSRTFVTGVKKFIEIANSNPLKRGLGSRKAFYANSYLGLHYANDLAKLWNTHNSESITASKLVTLVPSEWESTLQDGCIVYIYKGQQPAQALDALIKGPAVIDCGMFTQLSLWFGIRYMLGNERFNQAFGRAPFFITQLVYNPIAQSNEPYAGNPLHAFLAVSRETTGSSVSVKHLKNSALYPLKHPGGSYGGENCIVIDGQYYIFDPHLEETQGITKAAVMSLLHSAFNEGPTANDRDRLALYAEDPEKMHPKFVQTNSQLISEAERLGSITLTEEEFSQVEQDDRLELSFDMQRFATWLARLEHPVESSLVEYLPQPVDYSRIPVELLKVIPHENRTSMDFSRFKQDTPQQKELIAISQQFCQRLVAGEPQLTILSGKAGVGKTAAAVCAAKELALRGKKVVWISEVMVNGWADQAKTMADLDNCALEIDCLLATNPDALFLDDDNLAGFSGNLLLEKIYAWYVSHPGKGLFITSNESICFTKCYGLKLDGRYHYPPFSSYDSAQYLNWLHKTGLAGNSLRAKREGQSVGAVVSGIIWSVKGRELEDVEVIPSFNDREELAPIRRALRRTGSVKCDAYKSLSPIQQRWLEVSEVGRYSYFVRGVVTHEPSYLTAHSAKFEQTACETIALELAEYINLDNKKVIDDLSLMQLIRVLNYAHDQGGKRVILINKTSFNAEDLVLQIKKQLPATESERTWSRLQLLLCETDASIFSYVPRKQAVSERALVPMADKSLTLSTKRKFDFFRLDPLKIKDKSIGLLECLELVMGEVVGVAPKRLSLSSIIKSGLFRKPAEKAVVELVTEEYDALYPDNSIG